MRLRGLLAVDVAILLVLGIGIAFVFAGMVGAEDARSSAPELGKRPPAFSLEGYDGSGHSLSALKGKPVVLVFSSQKCPYSRAGDVRLAELAPEYQMKGVVFLSIDSHKSTPPGEIKEYALGKNESGKKLPYLILKDEGNTYADAMGAKRTPEIYIVDTEGKLVYHGALDNQKKPEDPEYVNYVGQALDEILAGQPVSKPKTGAYGCSIKRAK